MRQSPEENDPIAARLREYLLGRMSEEELSEFEHGLLANDGLFKRTGEAFEVVEDELAEEYLAGALKGEERTMFEGRLARSAALQDKVRFARAMASYSGRRRTGRANWFRALWEEFSWQPAYALALAALLLVVGGGWSVVRVRQLEGRLHESSLAQARQAKLQAGLELQLAEQRSRIAELSRALERTLSGEPGPGASPVAKLVWLALRPGQTRGSGAGARLNLQGEEELVEIRLEIGLAEFPHYHAVLSDAAGTRVVEVFQLPPTTGGAEVFVTVPVPARVLRPGDYSVALYGERQGATAERIDSYGFRVSGRQAR